MSEEFLTSIYAIEERIRSKRPCHTLFYDKKSEKLAPLLELAKTFGIPSQEISREQLKEYDAFHVALSIPAETLTGGTRWLKSKIKRLISQPRATILLLDGITDVHNIGAILRSCALFSVDLVIYPERRSASGDSDIVAKVSAGGSEIVEHGAIVNLNYAITLLKESGFWIYGAHMQGTSIKDRSHQQQKIPSHYALFLGAEGKGLSLQVRKSCDELLSIPTSQALNSLNVSVAAGILLYSLQTNRITEKNTSFPSHQGKEDESKLQGERNFSDRPQRRDSERNFSDRPQRRDRERNFSDRPQRRDSERNFSDRPQRRDRERNFSDRPQRRDSERNSFDRPQRRDSERNFSDRPQRRDSERNFSDRPQRRDSERNSFDRPQRRDSERNFSDRPQRRDRERNSFDRPQRRDSERNFSDRPQRRDSERNSFDRPQRRDSERNFSDRPQRRDRERNSFDRPQRRDSEHNFSDRPQRRDRERNFSDRPQRRDSERNSFDRPQRRDSERNSFDRPQRRDSERDSSANHRRSDHSTNKNKRASLAHDEKRKTKVTGIERRKDHDQFTHPQRKPRSVQRKREK
ncbi:23S rRNA (guanosine(2251)-2'-O)-methyltransferase RlmB [Entomospira entomophila]|uniref:23S rRNA (Guanosine(2251)-2'-O)-methyltransferase RlmB n=1 Tax=Entomospira entomophila TaxID=2719988 RepID=A0A968KQY8_9SPIO|nr:23S rRNA (guanosine(2251)-2'-O)-methyltransferase RlmB [Entomospira entomophilus]NIZ40183.1 23S rRNA (guanosine(2251)-2'-O)-methyltransferase RlmB [Entomospira entomophilus]WDI35742.1 23S rRNA (guanosine(2251)-2'-O)-methyltransferase RlmB [Entomospira entomophilus]